MLVFNATFSNISVKLWRSVLMVGESGVPGENHQLAQVTDKLYHIKLYEYTSAEWDSNTRCNPTTIRTRLRRPLKRIETHIVLIIFVSFVFSYRPYEHHQVRQKAGGNQDEVHDIIPLTDGTLYNLTINFLQCV